MTYRIHNTVLTLRFGFFAVLAVLLTLDGGVHVLPALLAVAVHETGHILAAKLCGMQIKSVTFGALGIHMAGETASVGDFRRAVVSLAGPFANLLSFLLLLPCSSRCSRSTCCLPYRWTAAPRFTVCCAVHLVKKRPSAQ